MRDGARRFMNIMREARGEKKIFTRSARSPPPRHHARSPKARYADECCYECALLVISTPAKVHEGSRHDDYLRLRARARLNHAKRRADGAMRTEGEAHE